MLNNLTFKHKKIGLLGILFLTLYIAYHFSFSKTFEAISINHQLHHEQIATQNLDASYPQIENEHSFYRDAIRLYKVNNDDRENRLWQTVSSIAINKNVKISFNPAQSSIPDTIAKHQLLKHEFNFKGNYFNCVSLLDSLSKTRGIGLISNLKLSAPRERGSENELVLQLTLATAIK